MDRKHQNEQTLVRGRTHFPCRSCGKPVHLQSPAAFIEPSEDTKRKGASEHVWHRACFDQYMEEGEEV